MKHPSHSLRRALTILLVVILLAGPLGSPASRVRADDEFTIDGTAFTEPEYDTAIMYFWHKGIPSVTKDKQGNYIKYPVLITWKDQYYLCTDANFKNELNETHTKQEKKNDHFKFYGIGIGYIGSDNFSFDDYDRVWGDTDYYMRYLYDTADSSLLAKLGMDVTTLRTLGEAVSMTAPNLPYLVPTDPSKDQYAIGLNEKQFGENHWLIGSTRTWEWVDTDILDFDNWQGGEVQWELDYEYWDPEQFLNKDYTYSENRTMYDVDTTKYYAYSEGADQHYWTVKADSGGKYHFWTTGENEIASWERITGSYGKDNNRQRMRGWFHANDVGRMSLYYKGSQIGVSAETVHYKDWKDRNCTVSNTDGYTVYYADPNIVSFYRQSFTVEKGQVINLDGPLVLDNSCTVTVKDGGVLACSGWVINNGQINVEPGGMIILQERDTATGDHQYGCISSVNVKAGTGSGRIACDGTIIVNRDCKLTCAGCYGLKLGSAAQVVNYGQIIAENLEVYTDHIIENRGDTSAVFAGWGVTDSGYALSRSKISGQSYNAKGNREDVAIVSAPKDAVYGEGAARFYVNPAGKVTYKQPEKKKGYVSGYTASISGSSYVEPEAAYPEIPIYYDSMYDATFIQIGNTIFAYDWLSDRWVNTEDGINMTIYDYRMPSGAEEYLDGELPEGYILPNGLVVGEAFNRNKNLRYDRRAFRYWFAEDDVVYVYEPSLQLYIHVIPGTDTYYRHHGLLPAPPTYDTEYISSDMYGNLPEDTELYRHDMQEVQDPANRPKVMKDGNRYYVEVDGQRYYWNSREMLFLPEDPMGYGSLNDGISISAVDVNGYILPVKQ